MINSILYSLYSGLGAMISYGSSDFLAKKANNKEPEVKVLFWGQAFGIITLTLIALLLKPSFKSITFKVLSLLALFAIIDTLRYMFLYKTMQNTKISFSMPIVSTYSVFASIIGTIFFKEQITKEHWILIVAVFTGILITVLGQEKSEQTDEKITNGLTEIITTTMLFAIWYSLWSRFIEDDNWITILIVYRSFMILASFLLSKFEKTNLKLKLELSSINLTLFSIGICDALGDTFLSWGFNNSENKSIIITLSSAGTIVTLMLARIFLKEKLTRQELFGILIIVSAVIIFKATQ